MNSDRISDVRPVRRVERSVLFADVCDSSRFYREMGDTRARKAIQDALALAREAVRTAGGRVVDNIGDEIFCVLPDADAALRAAIEIGTSVQAKREGRQLPVGLAFRIGFAQGPVELKDDQVYGDTVYLAKRVSTEAKYEQVLIPLETMNALTEPNRSQFRAIGSTLLKGRLEEVALVEALWGVDSTVFVAGVTPNAVGQIDCDLVLAFGDRSLVISKARPSVTLGRGDNCQLIIDDKRVSRLHARVELVEGKFVWADQSRNGSVIRIEGRPARNALRDKAPLECSGTIQLGPSDDAPSISFAVREHAL